MMGMSIPYESYGRSRQKTRTRTALVEAARSLLAEGATPTVEQTAERADIARTTAYRYFPNQRSLLLEAYPQLEAASLLGPEAPPDAASRLDIVTANFTQQVVDHEPELRATLRIALEPGATLDGPLPLRQGRAIRWIEDALAPLQEQMPERELHRLALAIRVVVGIEAYTWLIDIGGLSSEDAVATMRRSARALLRDALDGAGQAPSRT
jgi:AcrR family transcriptional regulator